MVEQPLLDWAGRFAYLSAKTERRQIELYAMDLVWVIASRYCSKEIAQPSEIANGRHKRDTRTAKQIIEDIYRKCGGE